MLVRLTAAAIAVVCGGFAVMELGSPPIACAQSAQCGSGGNTRCGCTLVLKRDRTWEYVCTYRVVNWA